jgi:hypothetical protein
VGPVSPRLDNSKTSDDFGPVTKRVVAGAYSIFVMAASIGERIFTSSLIGEELKLLLSLLELGIVSIFVGVDFDGFYETKDK